MAAEGSPRVESLNDYRVRLALDAIRLAIPATMPPEVRRDLLGRVDRAVAEECEEIVTSKIVEDTFGGLPMTEEPAKPLRTKDQILAARRDILNLCLGDMVEHPERYSPDSHRRIDAELDELNQDISRANEELFH